MQLVQLHSLKNLFYQKERHLCWISLAILECCYHMGYALKINTSKYVFTSNCGILTKLLFWKRAVCNSSMLSGDVMQYFKQNFSVSLNLINQTDPTFVSWKYPETMCVFASYGKAVHFSKLLFYWVSYYSSQMFPLCDVMYSKSGDSPVKFNFIVMYALKTKSMAVMAITAAHFK